MDECGFLGLALAVLAGQVHRQGQEPRAQEARDTSGHQVDEVEPWWGGEMMDSETKGIEGLLAASLGNRNSNRNLWDIKEKGFESSRGWVACHRDLSHITPWGLSQRVWS